jgi:cell division inhibitor SepF
MYNNAAMEEEDDGRGEGGARAYQVHEGGSGMGSRFSRWIKNLTGGGADDEEEYEDEAAEAETVATGAFATAPRTAAAGVATGTGYNVRASGGSQGTPRRDTFRLAHAREGSITVMPVSSFADIQKAADRLKSGEPQIVNLEKTPPEVAERLIDFLNGVTYALDGFVEKVAEGAYLFTPSHIAIQTDGPEPPAPKPFFDRV